MHSSISKRFQVYALLVFYAFLSSVTPALAVTALPPPVTVLGAETPQVHIWQHGMPLVVTPQGAYATANPVELGNGSALYDALHNNWLSNQQNSPSGGASASNPDGFSSAKPATSTTPAMLESKIPVGVTSPSGGASAGTGTMTKTVALGAGAGSVAVTLGKGVLGVAAGAAAFLGSPVVMGALMAASVGIAGYEMYQGMKGQGLTLNADGSGSMSEVPTLYLSGGVLHTSLQSAINYFYTPAGGGYSPDSNIRANGAANTNGSGLVVTINGVSFTQFGEQPLCYWGACYPFSAVRLFRGAQIQRPATNDDVINALTAATLANTAVSADIANFYLKQGNPLPPATPLQSAGAVTSLTSAASELSRVTDALGNVTTQLAQNTATIKQPATVGESPTVGFSKSVQTVTNGAPQSTAVTNLGSNPLSSGAIGAITNAAQQAQRDLCADHPDILACNVNTEGDVAPQELLKKDINVSFTPVNVSQNATCPAPVVIAGVGILPSKTISFDFFCTQLAWFKPLLLAFAWLSAAGIVFVGRPYQS